MVREIYAYTLNEIGEGIFEVHPTFEKALNNIKYYQAADVFRSYFYIEALYTDESTEKVDLSDYIEVRLKNLSDEEMQRITQQVVDGIDAHNRFVRGVLSNTLDITRKPFITGSHTSMTFKEITDSEKLERLMKALRPKEECIWKI